VASDATASLAADSMTSMPSRPLGRACSDARSRSGAADDSRLLPTGEASSSARVGQGGTVQDAEGAPLYTRSAPIAAVLAQKDGTLHEEDTRLPVGGDVFGVFGDVRACGSSCDVRAACARSGSVRAPLAGVAEHEGTGPREDDDDDGHVYVSMMV
jgi:hypothetical protein